VPTLGSVVAKAEKRGYAVLDKQQNATCFSPRE
jgi:hypothetical protein